MLKAIRIILLTLLLIISELSIVPKLPSVMSHLGPIIVFLVFVAVVYQFYQAVIWAIILGLMMESFSVFPFGTMIIGYVITIYICYFVFVHLFTNKSFYTLIIMTILGTVVFRTMIIVFQYLIDFIHLGSLVLDGQILINSARETAWQVLFNVILVIIIYTVFHHSSRRFKAVFIDTIKNN